MLAHVFLSETLVRVHDVMHDITVAPSPEISFQICVTGTAANITYPTSTENSFSSKICIIRSIRNMNDAKNWTLLTQSA